jgi:hypothetical protein
VTPRDLSPITPTIVIAISSSRVRQAGRFGSMGVHGPVWRHLRFSREMGGIVLRRGGGGSDGWEEEVGASGGTGCEREAPEGGGPGSVVALKESEAKNEVELRSCRLMGG